MVLNYDLSNVRYVVLHQPESSWKNGTEIRMCRIFFFFIQCSFVPNAIATKQHLHIHCRISYIGEEVISTPMFIDMCMLKYVL